MYIQTPGDKGPDQEALSKEGVHLPPGREGSSEAICKGGKCPGRGNSCRSCFCSPNLNWRDAEQGEDRVPEARVSAPRSLASGAQELFA